MSLKGLLHFWDENWADPDPFIMVTLFGQFKGKTGWHCLPIYGRNRSRKWVGKLLHRKVMGDDRFFKRGSDFDQMFDHNIRGTHRFYPTLFLVRTILRMFSNWRSIHRGAVLKSICRLDEALVNLMNRWRTKEGVRDTTPGLSMRQTYTQVRDVFSQLKLYSKAL